MKMRGSTSLTIFVFYFILFGTSTVTNTKQTVGTSSDGLTVKIISDYEHIISDSENKVHLVFEITTPAAKETAPHVPLELAIVLDRSGSMAGDNIFHAKEAVKNLIEQLHPDDKIHLIIYDHDVEVLFHDGTTQNKEKLLKLVSGITSRGSTFLSGGLEKGFEVLTVPRSQGSKSEVPESAVGTKNIERIKRIFLFSDGMANMGETNHGTLFKRAREMKAQDVTISAFGIGQEYNEDLMTGLAQHASGDYFFIESADKIEHIVSRGLGGLQAIYGTLGLLYLDPKDNVKIDKVLGYKDEDIIQGIQLNDIRYGSTKRVTVELFAKTPKLTSSLSENSAPQIFDLFKWDLSWQPSSSTDNSYLGGVFGLKLTEDKAKVAPENIDIDLQAELHYQNTMNLYEEVEEALKRGDRDAAKKIQKKLRSFHADKHVASSASRTTALRRADLLLSDIENEDVSTQAILKKSKAYSNPYFHQDRYYDDL